MKKVYLFVLFSFCILIHKRTVAQGIYQFWGATGGGGTDNQGVMFSTKENGTGYKPYPVFTMTTPGSNPNHSEPVVFNNKLYGVMPFGGLSSDGIIYEYDPQTSTYTKKIDLLTVTGNQPRGSLTIFNDKLYGITTEGGANDVGILFEYNPVTNTCVKRHDFASSTGSEPWADLVVMNNKLYGLASEGGSMNAGVLYEFDPATNVYSKKVDFINTNGSFPKAGMTEYNGLLYGITISGGINNRGVIFNYNPNTNALTVLKSMTEAVGGFTYGRLVYHNLSFYGMSSEGGPNNNGGTLFQYMIQTNEITARWEFNPATGNNPEGRLVLHDNKLFGLTSSGGANDQGVLFQFDIGSGIYQQKVILNSNFGSEPTGGMVVFNNKLYGFTEWGGANGNGTLFEYTPAGNAFAKKLDLRNNNGSWPIGALTYYKGNLYGTTRFGGVNDNGLIYKYDLATHTYTSVYDLQFTDGSPAGQGGFTVYNDKFYGVAAFGGVSDRGMIYKFDPTANTYTILHEFSGQDGSNPAGKLVLFSDNKFYGTTLLGGTNGAGTIYQFDPVTNTHVKKVNMADAFGSWAHSGLTLWNNKFYGTTQSGGVNDKGVLYQYDPVPNSYMVEYHFNNLSGNDVQSDLIVHDNKLWGTASLGGAGNEGSLFSYEPGNFNTAFSFQLPVTGENPTNTLLSNNGKLYGMTFAGSSFDKGELFEFNTDNNEYTRKTVFNNIDGAYPDHTQLIKIPAVVAPGNPGNCAIAGATNVDASNNNEWIAFTDDYGNAVAEINANGNNLGRVLVQFYVHNGPVRADGNNRKYLDRNITITVDNQPVSPVSVRLYIRKTEFETIKNSPGSGVLQPADLAIFKSEDDCFAAVNILASKIISGFQTWGVDYVYTANVTSFSTFYFASRNFTALPVHILSFKGSVEPTTNKLEWKADCTDDVDFTIERSIDGTNFQAIGLVMAFQQDCNHPFTFHDLSPASKTYYRLRMKEKNGPVTYSQIILLKRDGRDVFEVRIVPNPVIGSQANLQIISVKKMDLQCTVSDVMGRIMLQKQIQVQPGVNSFILPVGSWTAGVYHLVYNDGERNNIIRFVKQ
jgi:uncharacterized repeat protein (TIGR03803 family)